MIVKFLGTGTSQGIPVIGCDCEACTSQNTHDDRLRPSIYLSKGENTILVDCGPDLRTQLLRYKIDDVDHILLTHEHNDHTAGLDDIRPINFKHHKTIPIYGLPRVIENIEKRFDYIFESNPYPGSPKVDAISISPYELLILDSIEVMPIEYTHSSITVMGYVFDNKVAYLTDLSAIEEKALSYLGNLKILILDCLQFKEHHAHLSLNEAIDLAQKIQAEKTYLIHMSHTMGPVNEWSKTLPENIFASFDGLELMID